MTAAETAEMVRILLDDHVDQFATTPMVERAIDWAQLDKVKSYISADNEMALRPLYRETRPLTDASENLAGSVIRQAAGTWPIAMLPRTCRLWPTEAAVSTSTVSVTATSLEYGKYINWMQKIGTLLLHPTYTANQDFPQAAYFTVRRTVVSGASESVIYFTHTDTDQRAVLRYIAQPPTFNIATATGLAVPAEYHPEIAAAASTILNNMDAGEMERGIFSSPQRGEQLPLTISGGR